MPKRILDGDAVWTSSKIAALEPAWVRPEYTWVHSLAGPNGVFEFDLRAIWARCYAFLRPEIGLPEVEIIFTAFHKTKLVFLWEQDGKQWAYWTNSDKPGRLPRKSWQKRYAERGTLGPYPPEDALKKFMQEAAARPSRASNTPEPCKPHASGVQGIGIGSGTGIGSGSGAHPSDSLAQVKTPSPCTFEGIKLKIREKEHRGFLAAFPSLDLEQEYRVMDAWLVANPKQPKKNHARFALSWLKRSETKRKDRERQETGQGQQREMVKL